MNQTQLVQAFFNSSLPTVLLGVATLFAGAVVYFIVINISKLIQRPPSIDQKITARGEKYGRYGAGKSDSL